jgi:hypothetical protein
MRKAVALLLVLASCSSFQSGTESYHDGMSVLPDDPDLARKHFARAEAKLAGSLADGGLDIAETVTATANRARSLIELSRHEEAAAMLTVRIRGYNPNYRHQGDILGLALVKAHHMDPERGYAQLVLAERWAATEQTRLHLSWQQVRFLRNMGTPKARAEAVKICGQNEGRLDFDAMKKELSAP